MEVAHTFNWVAKHQFKITYKLMCAKLTDVQRCISSSLRPSNKYHYIIMIRLPLIESSLSAVLNTLPEDARCTT